VSRLPEKYRAPVVLCHLEGLSHAEAAARLRWPVGTVSGRLSRARGLLKDRLVRRGLTSTAGTVVALLAADGARAAVPEPLAAATARASAALACGGKSHAGTAAALSLMNEVMRSVVATKLKVAATVLLALAATGTAAVRVGSGTGAPTQAAPPFSGRAPAVTSRPDSDQAAAHRPAAEIVKEIDALLQPARGPVPQAEFMQTRYQIAALVDELRTAYPEEPRLTRYLPERWESLTFFRRRADILDEIGVAQRTAKDPAFKQEARLFETSLKFLDTIDGRTAVTLAEALAQQAPRDRRTGELLRAAQAKLDDDWYLRAGMLANLLAIVSLMCCTVWARSALTWPRLKLAAGPGALALVLLVCSFCSFQFLPYDRQNAVYDFFVGKISALRDPTFLRRAGFVAYLVLYKVPQQLESIVQSVRTSLSLASASAIAICLVIAQRRFVATPRPWMATIRVAALGFIACLAGVITVDAFLIAGLRTALAHRIALEYPGLIPERLDDGQRSQREHEARLVEGQRRQVEGLGKPFDLEFADAITGRPISLTTVRGKVVVVDFWASDRGPFWSAGLSELKRLYAEYHPKGVEFIGVSLDRRAVDGGLVDLKSFVAREQTPWPQFHEGSDSELAAKTPPPADRLLASVLSFEGVDSNRIIPRTAASEFALSWGIGSLPADFLIDTNGNLYSAEARGQLDMLIPRLLEQTETTSAGH
jgi:hypothetical protein